MLGLKIENSNRKVAVFWLIELIKYTSFEYKTFNILNIKVNYKPRVLDQMRNFLKIQNILDNE